MEEYRALPVMQSRLRETGLYTVDGNTLVDAELKAYAAGLQIVMDAYERLEKETMVQTAEDYGLVLREALVGQAFPQLELAMRRQMLVQHLAIDPNGYSISALEAALDCIGITAQLQEVVETETLHVIVLDVSRLRDQTEEAVKALAEKFLPAHLLITYDFSQITQTS